PSQEGNWRRLSEGWLPSEAEFKNRRKSRSRRGNEAEVFFAPKSASLRRLLPFFNTPWLPSWEGPGVGCFLTKWSHAAQIFGKDLFLPLPTMHEWGADRGEGNPTSLLFPALSSMRWRRGGFWGVHFDTATAGPRTVPVRSRVAGIKTLEFSRPPRLRNVLRA